MVGAVDCPIRVDLEMEADAHPAVEAAGPAPRRRPVKTAPFRAAPLSSHRGGKIGGRCGGGIPLRKAAAAAASAAAFGTERRVSKLRPGGQRLLVCQSEEDQVAAEEDEAEEEGQAHSSSRRGAQGILQRRRRLRLSGARACAPPAWEGIVGPLEGERDPRARRWHGDIYNSGDLTALPTCLESKGGSLRQPFRGWGRLAGPPAGGGRKGRRGGRRGEGHPWPPWKAQRAPRTRGWGRPPHFYAPAG